MIADSGDGRLLGAIEAGGTKFVLAVGDGRGEIFARTTIDTLDPEITLGSAADWLERQGNLAAIGIACFGPVELDRDRADWGFIKETPKPGWSNRDVAGYFARRFRIPVGFDTDVNGAALGEFCLRSGPAVASLAYVTVGTGIGGGLVIAGAPLHGAGHPEMGHIFPHREPGDHEFPGICHFHRDCLEGLASGPAILARWGSTLSELPAEHEANELVAGYLAQLCHTLFAVSAVELIVLGGGVMQAPGLLERVRARAQSLGSGYFPGWERQVIERPALGQDSGISGALMLARNALTPSGIPTC